MIRPVEVMALAADAEESIGISIVSRRPLKKMTLILFLFSKSVEKLSDRLAPFWIWRFSSVTFGFNRTHEYRTQGNQAMSCYLQTCLHRRSRTWSNRRRKSLRSKLSRGRTTLENGVVEKHKRRNKRVAVRDGMPVWRTARKSSTKSRGEFMRNFNHWPWTTTLFLFLQLCIMVRFKSRYLLAEIISFRTQNAGPTNAAVEPHNFSKDELFNAVRESIKLNFGDYGLGCLMPTLQSTPRVAACLL